MISSNFTFNFIKFCVVFVTKLLTLGISFSAAVRGIVMAQVVTLGALSLTSFSLAFRAGVVAKLVISCILSSISLT